MDVGNEDKTGIQRKTYGRQGRKSSGARGRLLEIRENVEALVEG